MSETEKNRNSDKRTCGSAFSDTNLSFSDLLKIKAKFGRNISDIFELNAGQSWMFQFQNRRNNRSAFFLQMTLLVEIELDKQEFEDWVNEVCKARQALRFAYVYKGMERPHCVELKERNAEVNFFDMSSVAEDEVSLRLQALEEVDRLRGFDLENDPLLRISAFKLSGKNRYAFIISQPHINSDGTSIGLLIKDIFVNYVLDIDDLLKSNKTNVFKKIAAFKNTLNIGKELDFWRSSLENMPDNVELPGKLSNDDEFEDQVFITDLPSKVQREFDHIQQRFKVTPFNFLQTVWAVMIGRITGKLNATFGVITSGRDVQVMESMLIPGGFVRALPVYVEFENNMLFSEVAKNVQDNFLEGLKNSHCSPEQIKEVLGRKKPLFTHILNCHNFSGNESMAGPNMSLEGFKILDGTAYDNLAEDFAVYFRNVHDSLKLGIGYNASAFTRATVELYAKTYIEVLERILLSDDDIEIGKIVVPSASEFEKLSNIDESKHVQGIMTTAERDAFRKVSWEKAAEVLCAETVDQELIRRGLNGEDVINGVVGEENSQKINKGENKKELSIITPFHNIDLDVFEKTKKSVLSVLKGNWEWVIVLHNTTTITVEDMQKLFDGYSNVKIVAKKDDTCTPSSPRNAGIDVATGDYIYFLDGDDEVNGDFLLKALEKMKSDGDDIVVGKADVKVATEDVFVVPLQLDFPIQRDGYIVPHEPESMGKLLYGTPMMLACKVTKRSVIDENNIRFDEDVILTEDMLFSFECYLKAKRICVLGDVVAYTYVQRDDSLLQSMMSKEGYSAKDYLLPIERIVDLAIKNNVSPSRYIWTMLGMFGAIAGNVQMEEQKKKELMQGIQKFLPLVNPEHMVSNKTYVRNSFVVSETFEQKQVEKNLQELIKEYNKNAQIKINKKSLSVIKKDISKLSAEQQSNVISGFQNIIDKEKSDIAVALLISGAKETKVIYKVSMVISKALGKDCIVKAIRGDK